MISKEALKDERTFKLYISFKDTARFEMLLQEQGIPFHLPEGQMNSDVRYYFLEKDQVQIDTLIVENQITSTKEGYPLSDYRYSQKLLPLLVMILVILTVFFLVILFG